MVKKNKIMLTVGFLLLLGIVFVSGSYLGLKTGRKYEINSRFCQKDRFAHLFDSLKEVAGFRKYYSQVGQDRWIVNCMFPDIDNGFFVDVGSADGVRLSNTKLIEELGWKGICIDPFPTNMKDRTCELFKEVVYSEAGRKVRFRAAGILGGVDEHIRRHKEREVVKKAKVVEFTTTTLDNILARAKAPNYIHYISIDIEGAELHALKGFSFSKYKVGAFIIEHNYEEPKRSQIRTLLENKGYKLVKTIDQDDCYVFNQSRQQ